MNRYSFHKILSSLLLVTLILTFYTSGRGSETFPFEPSSRLSSGNWVKVRVPETGIYEISYQELREMGFSDPSKVGVYGKGGTALPISFTNGSTPNFTDGIKPVRVWHHDNKIFFYGRSVEELEFKPSSSVFERKSLNIYSNEGAYFLSDSAEPLLMNQTEKAGTSFTSYYLGFDYVYHEEEMYQNTTESGQLFWGENLLEPADGLKWPLSLPHLDVNAKAKLECRIYAADKSSGSLKYGITEATSGNRTFNVKHPSSASGNKVNPEFMHLTNPVISLAVPATDIEVYAKVENAKGSFINLDYWILTYGKQLPDFSDSSEPQERFTVTKKGSKPGVLNVDSDKDIAVFDITDIDSISLLASERTDASSSFYFDAPDSHRDFILCDLSRKQKTISGYESINNSDLHALALQGVDFLIITVPRYKDFAERLASLHRLHDGIEVAVATTTDLYNEFSGGVPDPMAYRAMMKMCYDESGGRLKNLLFVGKVYGDFRKILSNDSWEDYIIGFQDTRVTADTHAANAMDFFGFADDFIYASLQNNTMQVGVGLLPFYSEHEAENYLKKAERYLLDDNKAVYTNQFLSIGGVGDNHTHAAQSCQLADYWTQYSPAGQNNAVLPIDAYGEKEAKKKLLSELNNGKILTSYFGHGTSFGINSTHDFFRSTDIATLKNEKPGFMLICACDLSDTDHARKGFGELLVTGTPYGMLGSVMATRTVWSGQNFELAKLFSSSLYAAPEKVADSSNPSVMRTVYREKSPTIGEVFARAKTLSNYTNSLAYLYIGDPALTIPVPLRSISASSIKKITPGEMIRVKGTVAMHDSIHLKDTLSINSYNLPKDPAFNGKIVARLMPAETSVLSEDYITDTKTSGKELYFSPSDYHYAEYEGVVKDGEFDFNITIPRDIEISTGDTLRLLISAYDHTRDLSAAGALTYNISEAVINRIIDKESPQIALEYNAADRLINISVTDNSKMPADCLWAFIDGIKVNPQLTESSMNASGVRNDYVLYTDQLISGSHALQLSATDLTGNETSTAFRFVKNDLTPTLTLTSDRKAVTDDIWFTVENSTAPEWVLTITDAYGKKVYERTFAGSTFRWNCKDRFGVKAAPGLYNAVVKSKEPDTDNLFSSKLTFAIIE